MLTLLNFCHSNYLKIVITTNNMRDIHLRKKYVNMRNFTMNHLLFYAVLNEAWLLKINDLVFGAAQLYNKCICSKKYLV